MTQYEILTSMVACIAALISLVTWSGQRKLQREANDLQRATSKLAKKQLEILLREDADKDKARLTLDVIKGGKSYRFRITNISVVDAYDVEMELLLDDPKYSPIIQSEYKEKFPAKKLAPGSAVILTAALHLGSPTAYNARLRWRNPDGSPGEDQIYAAL
ncbi:hypothetical protein ACG33_00025 [Steroidobacter denitrificans]|uniref:Uncharacterized protein n=1 Tax=Steroidobacter denitrificans TaxID=465721 RepID=A0A127F4Z5_STEDE|nr:hypothetical protein [Steroidobacter denitrificans]AMN45512.1 hypothetical protein ACG33_00025 [Steroidobacter denitrificans]